MGSTVSLDTILNSTLFKVSIFFLKFIVDHGKSADGAGSTAPRTFQVSETKCPSAHRKPRRRWSRVDCGAVCFSKHFADRSVLSAVTHGCHHDDGRDRHRDRQQGTAIAHNCMHAHFTSSFACSHFPSRPTHPSCQRGGPGMPPQSFPGCPCDGNRATPPRPHSLGRAGEVASRQS